jgi:hypothetical protein
MWLRLLAALKPQRFVHENQHATHRVQIWTVAPPARPIAIAGILCIFFVTLNRWQIQAAAFLW